MHTDSLSHPLPQPTRRRRGKQLTEAPRQLSRRTQWETALSTRILLSDLVVLTAVITAGYVIRFDAERLPVGFGSLEVSYSLFSVAVLLMWMVALGLSRTRDPRVLGAGYEEYQRIFLATFMMFGWLAILALWFQWELSRGFLALVFCGGTIGLFVSRKLWRSWIATRRGQGQLQSRLLVVGGVRSAERIGAHLESDPGAGYRVAGVWIPDVSSSAQDVVDINGRTVPVLGTERSLGEALRLAGADTVLVTDTEHLGHDGMRDLGWELEASDVRLLVAPNVVDVAGPRILMRAAGNMPLIHLAAPQYKGATRLTKAAFDKTFAVVGVLVASPLLVAAALAVKLSSPGPILYKQVRVGKDGKDFAVWKFRSMRVGAEAELPALMATQGGSNGPLFKLAQDPRVTRVGRVLRKYSIDELPQFANVLRGEMSIVGPRPHLPDEVAMYDRRTEYRLRVRPGMTGLWQVSGRADLSWDDAVRLDLDYVENWSMIRDFQIVWRTIRAVTRSDGAY